MMILTMIEHCFIEWVNRNSEEVTRVECVQKINNKKITIILNNEV